MSCTWRDESEGGEEVDPPEAPSADLFPTQADAETWLGENWRELRHAGIAQVSLLDGDRVVYGAMSLAPPE